MPETRFQFFVLITSAFRTSLPSAVSYGVDRSLREHLCQNKRFSKRSRTL